MKINGYGYVLIGLIILVTYQTFLRYQYVQSGYRVQRIDRLAGSICTMPCTPAPEPTETPERTYDTDDELAVQAVKKATVGDYQLSEMIASNPNASYLWRVSVRAKQDNSQIAPGQPMPDGDDPSDYRYRLVCDCYRQKDGHLFGRFWEYDLQNQHVSLVNDDAQLEKKYGIGTP